MKKSIKSVLAKSLAVAMAFSLAGIAPTSDAAAKKPTLTKKVTVTVGKTKTVKVTSKKKVKKTTWSLKKGGSKLVSLSKKKAKSVVVKGKKKGTTTLTAKIKVGSKNYKKTCKITVKNAAKVTTAPTNKPAATATPNNNGGSTATAEPTATPCPWVGTLTTDKGVLTVDEDASYNIPLTALNETTATSTDKRSSDSDGVTESTVFNRDGSVTFTSSKDYNSGVSFYINPCTSEDQLDASEDNEEIKTYANGVKDVSAYDYIRVLLTSEGEMNLRTYADTMQFTSSGFPGSNTSETYEGSWVLPTSGTEDSIFTDQTELSAGMGVKDEYKTRTIFIPLSMLISKGMDPEKLEAIAFSPQSTGVEVTIHRIDFVKVKYEKLVTGIEVSAAKTEIAPGKTTTVTATVTPADATREAVKWTSSDDTIATVNFQGTVVASKNKTGEVTITATATDGSGVAGSTTIKVADPSEEPENPDTPSGPVEITTHKVDLSKVEGASNIYPIQQDFVPVTPSADGVAFEKGCKMAMVDFSKYLADNKLDLSDYTSIDVTYEVRDADGKKIEDWGSETAPSYGHISYVPEASLNGYGGGINETKYLTAPFTGEKYSTAIANLDAAALATVVGFNIQLETMPETYQLVITDITFVK